MRKLLREFKICQSDCVVHFFPKPNVAILTPNATPEGGTSAATGESPSSERNGDHSTNTKEEEAGIARVSHRLLILLTSSMTLHGTDRVSPLL